MLNTSCKLTFKICLFIAFIICHSNCKIQYCTVNNENSKTDAARLSCRPCKHWHLVHVTQSYTLTIWGVFGGKSWQYLGTGVTKDEKNVYFPFISINKLRWVVVQEVVWHIADPRAGVLVCVSRCLGINTEDLMDDGDSDGHTTCKNG